MAMNFNRLFLTPKYPHGVHQMLEDYSFLSSLFSFMQNTGIIAGAIGAVIGTGYSAWRYIIKPLKGTWHRVEKTCDLVQHELSPNGGDSIKDRISRIDLRLMICEARTRAAMQLSGIAHWESDEEGQCIYASPELCRLSGYLAEQIKGYGWINMIPEEQRAEVKEEWDRCVEDEREFSMDYSYIHPEKGIIQVHGQAFIVRDDNGNMKGLIGVATKR